MLSVSILGIKENIEENIKKLDKLGVDYFHIDIMDGLFVSNTTWKYGEIGPLVSDVNTKLDIHLMVNDVKRYVDDFVNLKPDFITFHYEACDDVFGMINYVKDYGVKVGLSIKPGTLVSEIEPFLPFVDLVLVMSVEPGSGGQPFILSMCDKINELYEIRQRGNFSYLIEVDGGINNITKENVGSADILVVGSYITNNDYEEKINEFKKHRN